MALKRTALKAMGIEDEKIDQIIEMHTETTDGLKAQITELKTSTADLAKANKKIAELEGEVETLSKNDTAEQLKAKTAEFEAYKAEVTAKATAETKKAKFTEALKTANISEKIHNLLIKSTDLSKIELSDNGEIKDVDKLIETLKTENADFVITTTTKGANVPNPPANSGEAKIGRSQLKGMTTEEINEAWNSGRVDTSKE